MAINLQDYVPVHERLAAALVDGVQSIHTTAPVMLSDTMGYVQATVTLADGRSASGTASFRLDLTGKSAQATCPLEDAETSALGRALAFLGYESRRGVASREEVQEAQRRAEAPRPVRGPVSRVQAATNSKGLVVIRFDLAGETYTCYDVPELAELAEGDSVTVIPTRATAKGAMLADLIDWHPTQKAA